MAINVNVYVADSSVTTRLTEIERKLDLLLIQGEQQTMTLAQLKTQVEKNTTLEESTVTLINGLAAQIAAAKNDPAAIQALADQLTSSATDLSAAVVANTPAVP